MRHKFLSFYEHARSFVASTEETAQQTPGQEGTCDGDETRAANTEVLRELRERAAENSNTAILVITANDSA